MKHSCEGFKGWWETCPSADFVLPPGQTYTTSQLEFLTSATMVVMIVVGIILIGLFMTALIGLFDD